MPDQRLLALVRANEIRSGRKAIKDKLATRELLLDDVLEREPPECLQTMRLGDLIAAAYGFGPTKAKAALRRLRYSETRQVGSLSKRERRAVVAMLAKYNGRALYGAAHREYVC